MPFNKTVYMKIVSVFQNNEKIPEKYTCRGKDINPPLKIENIPQKTQSLVLMIDDPDAPNGTWIHWMVANIDPNTAIIAENSVPQDAVQGKNSWGKIAYGGPCPPSGTHRYFFKIYALDQKLDLKEGFTFEELSQKMKGHVLEYQELIGLAST